MTFEEARAWLDSTPFEREMANADTASDDALDEAASVLGQMSAFRSTHRSALQSLVRSHERAVQGLTDAIREPKFDSKSRKFGIRALPRLYFSMSYCTSGSHSGGAVL